MRIVTNLDMQRGYSEKFIDKISCLEGVIACRILHNEIEIIYDEKITTEDEIFDALDC
ncbi:hypothetical protein [Clostridium sp. DL1XJH146]